MAVKKSGTKTVYRDSKTGEWTKKTNVKKHPESTETEHRPIGKRPKRK
jgi:hypothetical protein